jgi:hypothetical protein
MCSLHFPNSIKENFPTICISYTFRLKGVFLAKALYTIFFCKEKHCVLLLLLNFCEPTYGAGEDQIRVWLILQVAKVQNAKIPSLASDTFSSST